MVRSSRLIILGGVGLLLVGAAVEVRVLHRPSAIGHWVGAYGGLSANSVPNEVQFFDMPIDIRADGTFRDGSLDVTGTWQPISNGISLQIQTFSGKSRDQAAARWLRDGKLAPYLASFIRRVFADRQLSFSGEYLYEAEPNGDPPIWYRRG